MEKIEANGRGAYVVSYGSDFFQASSDDIRNSSGCVDFQEDPRTFSPRLGSQQCVGLRVLEDVWKLENMTTETWSHPPAPGAAIQVEVVAIGRFSERLFESRATSFPDPVGPENARESANEPFWKTEILDDDGIISTPLNRFGIYGPASLGGGGKRFTSGPAVTEALVNLGAGRLIRVSGIKFPPDLTFRIGGQADDEEISFMSAKKAQGTKGLQRGESKAVQVSTGSRAGVNV
jgi:hypothetical protein